MSNARAIYIVSKAVKNGDLPPIKTLVCVDCGSPAEHYEHRDYDKPLEVEPVCRGCNRRRGPAKGPHDMGSKSKTISVPDDAHEKLQKIIHARKVISKSWNLQSNRSVVSELIDKAHKKECKK